MQFSPRSKSTSSFSALDPEPEPSPSPSPAGCPCEAEILRDGSLITDDNRNVQVGDRITLKVKCGDCALSEFKWTIPGTIFKDYQATKPSATKTDVPSEDFEKQELFFYWVDAADDRTVKCTFKAEKDGKKEDCSAEATLNVKRPTVSFSAVIGSYDLVLASGAAPRQVEIKLQPGPEGGHGIEFRGDVQVPADFDFPEGKWHSVQRLTMKENRRVISVLTCQSPPQNGQTLLDTTYPYEPPPYWDADGWPGGWTALVSDSSPQTWSDSPAVPLGYDYAEWPGYSQVYTDMVCREDFEMYIMYKPGTANSRWVPLQKINWWTDACLYHGTGTGVSAWTFGGSYTNPDNRCYAAEAVDTTTHPVWSDYFRRGLAWVAADCDEFCRP